MLITQISTVYLTTDENNNNNNHTINRDYNATMLTYGYLNFSALKPVG